MTLPLLAMVQDAQPTIVPADTAWMLTSTALVLLMTPALAFFYGGLVRSKNSLNTMMMSFVALGAVGITWALVAYSEAFAEGSGFLGSFQNAFLDGVGIEPKGTIPHVLFMAYPGNLRDHHCGADLRSHRRADAVRSLRGIPLHLDTYGLRSCGALGLGRRLVGQAGHPRLRRRYRRAHQRRYLGPCRGERARCAEGLRPTGHSSA